MSVLVGGLRTVRIARFMCATQLSKVGITGIKGTRDTKSSSNVSPLQSSSSGLFGPSNVELVTLTIAKRLFGAMTTSGAVSMAKTNHRNFDFFGAGSVQLEAQIMFPPSMSEIPIAGPYPELRPFLPFAPSDGAVRSLGRSMGL